MPLWAQKTRFRPRIREVGIGTAIKKTAVKRGEIPVGLFSADHPCGVGSYTACLSRSPHWRSSFSNTTRSRSPPFGRHKPRTSWPRSLAREQSSTGANATLIEPHYARNRRSHGTAKVERHWRPVIQRPFSAAPIRRVKWVCLPCLRRAGYNFRKFSSNRLPSTVRMDSGWNWTP